MPIRNSAKAIIKKNDKILLTQHKDQEGFFYIFPGGGQDHGESLHEAVKRECLEETGYIVEPHDIIHIREYIGRNHEYADFDSGVHQIEYYMACTIIQEAASPTNPDTNQVAIEWIPLGRLHELRVYPGAIVDYLQHESKNRIYLGDVN
ncbi:NUDIX domain-containing protein [Jeotgalibacillus sp. R-1-5s-1]|uniref:NUDIX domain-containing protein n=1 Tax=Jeotgalibacillus sp. R-1-5s-1 TaxID=2555897 RepID=UPI0010693655|nr:NUDIX domain-containing protein [Jeotgalibacillus sp. R-1-5s-1]TFE00127.1 NUDIX domain-containing protein [Jeotgalibacillus sp. R-1-5s-1]